jgi:hypothetical protein
VPFLFDIDKYLIYIIIAMSMSMFSRKFMKEFPIRKYARLSGASNLFLIKPAPSALTST